MATTFLYINLISLLTLVTYIFGGIFNNSFNLDFYLIFSLSVIFSSFLIFINSKLFFKKEGSEFFILILGYLIYGIANLLWYLFDVFNLNNYFFEFLNLLFLFQAITKHFFLIKEGSSKKRALKRDYILNFLIKGNLLILILTVCFHSFLSKFGSFFEIFFIFESVISILYIKEFLLRCESKYLNYKIFLFGNIFWLIGDLIFSYSHSINSYTSGDLSDFIYFLGFYLIISSVIFKDFLKSKAQVFSFFDKRFLY